MRGGNHPETPFICKAPDQSSDLTGAILIDADSGFIQKQQPRITGKGSGHQHPLALAT
jgi:hypothetical protein